MNTAKPVTVEALGSGTEHQTDIEPATTVAQILEQMGLSSTVACMEAPGGGRLMGPNEKLYPMVKPGEKLSVSPMMDAG